MSRHNVKLWKAVLLAIQIFNVVITAAIVLTPIPYSFLPVVVIGALIWIVFLLAVVMPLGIIKVRQSLTLDFNTGVIATRGRRFSAAQFHSAVETTDPARGKAHLFTLHYINGSFDVRTDGLAQTERFKERNNALAWFIWQWLPMPEQYRAVIEPWPQFTKSLIGKQEVIALLR